MYHEKCKVYATSEILWETLYDQGEIDTGVYRSKYHWEDVSWSIKIKVKGGNIAIVYIMVAYRLKVMHDEYYILNFSSTRQNRHFYPIK